MYKSCLLLFLILVFLSGSLQAKPSAGVKLALSRSENPKDHTERLLLPYAFSTQGMGTVLGLGSMRKGFHQEQMITGATAFYGPESQGLALGVWDYKLLSAERLFVSMVGMIGDYPRNRAYSAGRYEYTTEGEIQPGSNDSLESQYLEAAGLSSWSDFKLEYSFPFGATRDQGMTHYQLRRGLLVSEPLGGKTWNPLESGATVAVLRQFNRYQSYIDGDEKLEGEIHALELGLLYDNTDFPVNPSYGSQQYLSVSHDPGKFGSYQSWHFLEAEASKYFSLGSSDWARQRVLAFNGWLAYSPSWKLKGNSAGDLQAVNKPPFFSGAKLGGFYRMRGFDQDRFHDKAAIYTTAEYRYTLDYNPVEGVSWLRFLHMDWMQLVPFVEAGRVAPKFSSSELSGHWKTDVGIGLRALMAGSVIRMDVAHSSEGTGVWVMVGHPF